MNAKYRVLWISLFVIALFAGLSVTQAQTGAKADVVTAISNLENDGVKADLAGDPAFYQKVLAEDWTRGDSDGAFYTKAQLLKLMADTKNLKTNSEKLSELKVRVYGREPRIFHARFGEDTTELHHLRCGNFLNINPDI